MNKININEKIDKEKNLVILGKNGIGKTYLLNEIHNSPDFNTILVDFDLEEGFDNLITGLMSDLYISSNRKSYNEASSVLDNSVDELSSMLSSFDTIQKMNKYEMIESKHKLKRIDNGLIENSISLKYEYDNGKGINYFLKIQLLLKLLEGKVNVVLLIDEPEKYCFPGLIIRLAKELSNHSTKVVCASHSPVFVNAFINNFSELVFLKSRDEKYSYSSEKLIDVCYSTYDDRLNGQHFSTKNTLLSKKARFSSFFNNLLKLKIIESLYSDVSIVTEGGTDKQLIEYILQTSETYYNFNIIQANGKALFPVYLSILKCYDISTFSLFDLDNNKNDLHRLYNNYIMNNSTSFYKFENNIEDTFNLDELAGRDKVNIGPVSLLVKLLNGGKEVDMILEEIKEKIMLAYISNVVGKENVKAEIEKLTKVLSVAEFNPDGDNSMDLRKYTMLTKLLKKYNSNYDKSIRKLGVEKELKFGYCNIKDVLKLTNMNQRNFEKNITYYKTRPFYQKDNVELLFYVFMYDNKKKEFNIDYIREITLNERKLEMLQHCYETKTHEKFEDYLLDYLKYSIEELEDTYCDSSRIISDCGFEDQLNVKHVEKKLRDYYSNLRLIDRREKVGTFISAYTRILNEIM